MLHLLAELPAPDKEFVWQLILSAGVIISMLGNIYAVFGRKKIETQQPLIIEMQKEFVPLKKHEDLEHEVRSNFREVNDKIAKVDEDRRDSVNRCYKNTEKLVSDMRAEQRDDVCGINKRMDELLKAVSRMEGKLNA